MAIILDKNDPEDRPVSYATLRTRALSKLPKVGITEHKMPKGSKDPDDMIVRHGDAQVLTREKRMTEVEHLLEARVKVIPLARPARSKLDHS
ncbi:MAG: hypothetical protein V3W44_00770 [Dehalococcoidales bacterium]